MEEGFLHAEEMLRPTPYPELFPDLPKMAALQTAAEGLGADFYRLPINVTFVDGPNHVGVDQSACVLCGDCFSGCNYWAKNTTLMNYLPDARSHGAEFYTQVSVRKIERRGGRWMVHYQVLETGEESADAPTALVSADLVILAAGTLGTTEILLRSKVAGLALPDSVGRNFSGNGDVGGIAYNTDREINAVGFGDHDPEKMEPVGPTIENVYYL